jgi:hypothetical protein
VPRREPEDELRAVDVRLDRLDRPLHDQLHAHRGGQVEDDVTPLHRRLERLLAHDRVDPERQAGIRAHAGEVRLAAGAEVVEDLDLHPSREKGLDEMGADEAGSAGDESAHAVFLGRGRRDSGSYQRRRGAPRGIGGAGGAGARTIGAS